MSGKKDILLDCPIIAAVRNDYQLKRALQSECQIIFLLYGDLLCIRELTQKIQEKNKLAIIHIDLIDGLSSREIAVDSLEKIAHPDGIISTRASQIRRGRQLGLLTIQRAFILDSMSIDSLKTQLETGKPDFIEILPGIMPRVISEIAARTDIPLIAGGLIESKSEVLQAINAGAVSVSTSCQSVWHM